MMAKFYPTVNYNKVAKAQKQSPQSMSVSQYKVLEKYQSERVSPRA
jgi:hypothetical protein